MSIHATGPAAHAYRHGFYVKRIKTCEAPGCSKQFEARRLTSRFCSDDCRTNWGQWSYRASQPTNERAYGWTK